MPSKLKTEMGLVACIALAVVPVIHLASTTQLAQEAKVLHLKESASIRACPSSDCRAITKLDVGDSVWVDNWQNGWWEVLKSSSIDSGGFIYHLSLSLSPQRSDRAQLDSALSTRIDKITSHDSSLLRSSPSGTQIPHTVGAFEVLTASGVIGGMTESFVDDGRLVFRCRQGTPEVFIATYHPFDQLDFMGDGHLPVSWRFDHGQRSAARWETSSDGMGVFVPRAFWESFLRQSRTATALYMWVEDSGGVMYTFEFSLRGSMSLIDQVLACFS